MKSFPFFRQLNQMDCGPTCLKMIARYHGKNLSLEYLRRQSQINKEGVSLLGIAQAAENIGLKSLGVKIDLETLMSSTPLPAILHWKQSHFVVMTPMTRRNKIRIADPARGIMMLTKEEFREHWIATRNPAGIEVGIALLLERTPRLFTQEDESPQGIGWRSLAGYLRGYKKYFAQILAALLLGSLIQLLFPFLTQSIVDTGINTQDLQYITVILAAQLMLFLSRTLIEFIRSRLLLHISVRINIAILSDFWIKMMRLPISYFDSKKTGDILQRIGDHHRIENFLTGSALSTLFSVFSLSTFSIVLLSYDPIIFLVFSTGSILYFFWIRLFLKYRRRLDYTRFETASKENGITMQLIHGMQEIKLNNAEQPRRWEWENIQARLFSLSYRSLSISQYQQAGAFFINEGKNILLTFLVARMVIEGELTLGAMLAVQYIIGQLNSPVEQLTAFMQSLQDARISLERLNEIHALNEEEGPANGQYASFTPGNKGIRLEDVSFSYPGAGNSPVLNNITLHIPEGKTTAIVGVSGSGKTTLLKLLLKFYESYTGRITIGETSFTTISPRAWRKQCGCVMQDGFIFSDSIANNIMMSDENPDPYRLRRACEVAHILDFVESLPLGFNTKIGAEGNGISAGQKQRLLIARAVYKDPTYIFFDEATNCLDTNNEKNILEKLAGFFSGKTVVVIAHRLSTVRNADNIVVIHESRIAESGTHEELIRIKGKYFDLIKNQLDLGT